MTAFELGSELPTLRLAPDVEVTARYASASGDFNPIHLDEEFAKSVGLPGRVLHGLYTMALLARAQTEAAGGPETLKRLAVTFRGVALPEHEITITSTVSEQHGDRLVLTATATQQGKAIIRNATVEIEPRSAPA
jgi:acyl dehydratase